MVRLLRVPDGSIIEESELPKSTKDINAVGRMAVKKVCSFEVLKKIKIGKNG